MSAYATPVIEEGGCAKHESEDKTCSHCGGDGFHDDGSRCTKCDGSGTILTASSCNTHNEDKCNHCDGRGYHDDKSRCETCDGSGSILTASSCNTEGAETDQDIEDLIANPDEEHARKNYGSVQAYKKMLRSKIKRKKAEKKVSEGINNSQKAKKVMTKSNFDKLFEQVIGDDDDALELGIDLDGEVEGDGAAELDGGDVTVTLSQSQVEVLKDILSQVEGEGEDELGDEEPGGDLEEPVIGGDEVVEEENHPTKEGEKPGVDPSSGGGEITEPSGDSLGGKSSGTGDADVTDEEGTKETGDGKQIGKTSAKTDAVKV